ncbi:MAG: lipopolysaccharide biosynthesis protein [Sphingobacteriia bacterium]|nr:MAG: lipopolysaccharide biosynthesis protein [Sphingobacteriia bacterium]
MSHSHHPITDEEPAYSFAVVLQNWKRKLPYLLHQWKLILGLACLGALLGLAYSWYKPITYTARLTFVVEDSKSASGGLAGVLAGQMGLDIGGLTGGSGVLQGDNVLELLKSKSLLKKALLTPYDSSQQQSLADTYASSYKWKEKWLKHKKIGQQIQFGVGKRKFSRTEDSLLHLMMKQIVEKELSITKPDKKLGIFALELTTRNELLSALICERLLKVTTDFYVETKTKRLKGNVDRLQQRVDSLGRILNIKTYSAANANRQLLDGNPAFTAPEVNAEISSREKLVQSTVFAELTKNLEASKTVLIQETPTVQVVDWPELPLKENQLKWWFALLAGTSTMVCLGIVYVFNKPV